MKRYTIHILGKRAINADAFDPPFDQCAVIDCSDSGSKFIEEALIRSWS